MALVPSLVSFESAGVRGWPLDPWMPAHLSRCVLIAVELTAAPVHVHPILAHIEGVSTHSCCNILIHKLRAVPGNVGQAATVSRGTLPASAARTPATPRPARRHRHRRHNRITCFEQMTLLLMTSDDGRACGLLLARTKSCVIGYWRLGHVRRWARDTRGLRAQLGVIGYWRLGHVRRWARDT